MVIKLRQVVDSRESIFSKRKLDRSNPNDVEEFTAAAIGVVVTAGMLGYLAWTKYGSEITEAANSCMSYFN
jgi:hypothetical protein